MNSAITAAAATKDLAAAPAWNAVFAMSLAVFALIASEFMPMSLLTPIAGDLGLTEGQAGQAIAVSGLFAVITSLCIKPLIGKTDRRLVLMALNVLMILSGTMVAFAPNASVFMIGRALIGVVIGGFWSISAATVMRLVPENRIAQGLAILNGGNALATVIAAPAGTLLGSLVGWRGAFFCVVPVAVIALIWQAISLPAMRPTVTASGKRVWKLLAQRRIAFGISAVSLLFMGQFSLFTYLRPFLETDVKVSVSTLSLLLLLVGVAGLVGTMFIGQVVNRFGIGPILTVTPILLAVIGLSLIIFSAWIQAAAVLLALWGLISTSAPVVWWTWLAKALPNDAETGGGLMVATIQLAIAFGATLGGILFDTSGYILTFTASATLLLIASPLALASAEDGRYELE